METTIKNYKYKLYLNEKQRSILEKMENASKDLWNAIVEKQIESQDFYNFNKIEKKDKIDIFDAKQIIKIAERQSIKISDRRIKELNELISASFDKFKKLKDSEKEEELKERNKLRSFLTVVFFNFENRLNSNIGKELNLSKKDKKVFSIKIPYHFQSSFKNENFSKAVLQKEFTQMKKNRKNKILPFCSSFFNNVFDKSEDSYKQFFRNLKKDPKKAGIPRYKSERDSGFIGFKNAFKNLWNTTFEENSNSSYAYFCISKNYEDIKEKFDLGYLKFKCFKPFLVENVRTVQFKKEGSEWFVIFSIQEKTVKKEVVKKSSVGIDRGISTKTAIAIVSNKNPNQVKYKSIDFPEYILNLEKIIPKKKSMLYRRKKDRDSKNFKKEIRKISKLQLKLKRQKENFLKKEATLIAKKSEDIYIEDLKISNMTKTAKGNVDNPGKKVSQKTGLNRSILSKNWGYFAQKLNEYSKNVKKVDPKFTSQTCSCCGKTDQDSRKDKKFICTSCNYRMDADHNAALVIYKVGRGLIKISNTKKNNKIL